MSITRVKLSDVKKAKGNSRVEEVKSLSDAKIYERALSDSDSAIPTERELQEFKPAKERNIKDDSKSKTE